MTENEKIREKILCPLQAGKPADGGTPVSVEFGSLDKFIDMASDRYVADREDYLNTSAADPALLAKTKKWQRSARQLISWAETWFFTHPNNSDEQNFALDLLDRISKESGMRLLNIAAQERIVKKNDPENINRLSDIDEAYCSADFFLRSAVTTQQHFIDRYTRGDSFVSFEEQEERKVAPYFEQIVKLLPVDRIYSRGIIFPPARIPAGEPVPESPEVFNRVKFLPVEDLVYDPVIDELVPRPGYVSEDGKIDDKSVIWHPETMTVEMGYVGEEKVVWSYWKPKDVTDLFEEDSWVAEYLAREYDQWIQNGEQGLFRKKAWD